MAAFMEKDANEQAMCVKTEEIYIKTEPEWDEAPSDMHMEQEIRIDLEPEVQIKVEPQDVKVKVEPLQESEQPEWQQPDASVLPGWPLGDAGACEQVPEPERAINGGQLAPTNPLLPQKPTENNTITTKTRRKLIECDVCQKQFPKTAHLKRHQRIHTGERPYSCEICKKEFAHLFAFNRHTRSHTGEKPHTCEICHKQFTEQHNLLTHKRIHTGERPYVCEVCQKPFIKSTDLNKHKRVHTGEKPFGCNICHKQFSSSGNLTKHIRTHTGEKRHCCQKCDKQFTKRVYLEKHVLLHNQEKLESVCIKVEPLLEELDCEGSDAEAERGLHAELERGLHDHAGLYADHEVKDDPRLGPEVEINRCAITNQSTFKEELEPANSNSNDSCEACEAD